MDIAKILAEHKAWLTGKGGRRADLRGVDLRGVDLSKSDLSKSDLRWSDLSKSDLSGAVNLICLHVHHPAGYRPIAVPHNDGWRIFAGCRSFTVSEALEHWGSPTYHTPALGAAYVRAIKEQLCSPGA